MPKPTPLPASIHSEITPGVEEFVRDLKRKRLVFPIAGADIETLQAHFSQWRGNHMHHAVDILTARHTPVLATDNGRVAKLFYSAAGGTTIYQFDPTEQYVYYYAHLQGYVTGLADGDLIRKGQVIAYVGTSGNAPPNTPHLHFSISRLDPEKRWWKATPIDPYLVFH